MKTNRPLAINNSLVHGICNYNCRLCGVNKPSYHGPRHYQSEAVTRSLIDRCLEAAHQGVAVRYIANAGDGEPTLHPEFTQRMALFGDMIRRWPDTSEPPEVSVVTNGSHLSDGAILQAIADNGISLIVSFPTADESHYGEIVMDDASQGQERMAKALDGISRAFALHAQGVLKSMEFHISPPEREIIRPDFEKTVSLLSAGAQEQGVDTITLVLFPATSNRSGLIRNNNKSLDNFSDLVTRFHGKSPYGVRINVLYSLRRFFKNKREMFDVMRSFIHPCLWNGNLFITAQGESICSNDQAVKNPLGTLEEHSIAQLMENKENARAGVACSACDQSPSKMSGSAFAVVWRTITNGKYFFTQSRFLGKKHS